MFIQRWPSCLAGRQGGAPPLAKMTQRCSGDQGSPDEVLLRRLPPLISTAVVAEPIYAKLAGAPAGRGRSVGGQGASMTAMMPSQGDYGSVHDDIVALLEAARRAAARSVNALMTATYWEIGRRIVEFEQGGKERAA